MSDRNNSDNQNTNTIYIPPSSGSPYGHYHAEQRGNVRPTSPPQHNAQPVRPLQRQAPQGSQQRPQQGSQQRPQQGYQQRPQQGSQQRLPQGYQQRPQQGYQQRPPQQYRNDQYYNGGYGGEQYYGDPYYREPYQGQPYPNQPPPYPYPHEPQRRSSGGGKKKTQPKKSRRKPRRKSLIGRLLTTLLIIFLLLFGVYSCTAMSLIKKMEHVDTAGRSRRSDALSRSYVTNVLLIGTDGRTSDERGRSDTMMLASLNSKTDKVSLISFMRDCYVEIPDYGWDKLNASYSYGGPELLMDTIEHNFGIAIDDYVSVNFVSFANIVDAVGGIDVEISDAEAQEINTILQAEVNEIMGDGVLDDLLKSGGDLHLNGKQALSYARIRYIGNADFERTERQRRVMELVMNELKSVNPTLLPKLSSSVLPGVSTNMSTGELYALSLRAPFLLGYDRQQLQIPAEGTYYGENTSSGDALIVDFNSNYNVIYETAFTE